jgi:hypothetical protein
MSLRVGFDVDGVLANFTKTFHETAAHVEGHTISGPRELTAAVTKRVWDHIAGTPQWWLRLDPFEPEQIRRLYRISRERRWEVYFMTTRPASGGETTQFQTQWWLEQQGFALPSVLTVPGSRGDAANAVKLDIAVDDRISNCVDIIAASRAKAILLQRRDDVHLRDQALARGIAVVGTLEAAIDAIEQFEQTKAAHSGRLSRLTDWFKPSRQQANDALPMDARRQLGPPSPPLKGPKS